MKNLANGDIVKVRLDGNINHEAYATVVRVKSGGALEVCIHQKLKEYRIGTTILIDDEEVIDKVEYKSIL